MELRNAFKLRFNRHHTIHQVTPSNPFLSLSSCSREKENERERETARSKKFFFPGHLEQANDVAFLHFLKDGPRDQREQKERKREDKWCRNFLCR
jgi:hypothetical protein